MYRGGGVIDLGLIPEKAKDFYWLFSIYFSLLFWLMYPLSPSQIVVPEWQFLAPQGEVVIAWCNHLPLVLHNNKFATKNDPQRQLTKKWPKRHFAEEVNRNENLQNMIQSHNLQTRCCQDQQGVAEMLCTLRKKCFENLKKKNFKKKLFWKDNLQKKLSKTTICKKW